MALPWEKSFGKSTLNKRYGGREEPTSIGNNSKLQCNYCKAIWSIPEQGYRALRCPECGMALDVKEKINIGMKGVHNELDR